MATILVPDHPEITVINGRVVTSSVAIADYFLKRHDDVLKKIRTLECSPVFMPAILRFAVKQCVTERQTSTLLPNHPRWFRVHGDGLYRQAGGPVQRSLHHRL